MRATGHRQAAGLQVPAWRAKLERRQRVWVG